MSLSGGTLDRRVTAFRSPTLRGCLACAKPKTVLIRAANLDQEEHVITDYLVVRVLNVSVFGA